jgi:cysteine-rich repeat protein
VCSSFQQFQFQTVTVLSGSTLLGTSVTEGTCVGPDSPEVIFPGESDAGILTFTAPPGHGIHVRKSCSNASTELACIQGTEAGGDSLEVTVDAYSPLTVVVEAIDPFMAGPFEVPVTFSPLGCGDGQRLDPEVCDDGNHTSGDGCDAACSPELDVLCAAMPVVALGQTMDSFPGTSRSFYGVCAGSLDLPERGYRHTAASGSVTVTVTATADLALYTTLSCGDLAPSLGCADAVIGSGQETLTLATQPGDELTFYVELGLGQPENANFTLEVTEP